MIRRSVLGIILAVISATTASAVDTAANQKGRLTSTGNGQTRTFYQYDANGRGTATQHVQDGQSRTFTVAYGYPQNPQSTSGPGMAVISEVFPDGDRITYTYDASSTLVRATSTLGGLTQEIVRDRRVNARGAVTQLELGNGTVTRMDYDESGHQALILTTTVTAANQKLQEYAYSYDNNLNVTGVTDGVRADQSVSYSYDSLNQLKSILNASGNVLEQYGYDAIGNLTQKGALTQAYGPSRLDGGIRPHALLSSGGVPYGYDDNGNVTSIGSSTTLEWNAENMSTRVTAGPVLTQKSFVGESLWKKVEQGATTYFLPAMRVETSGPRKYYGGYAERQEAPGDRQLRFYHPDHLGSSAVMTDQSGTVIRRASYLPWGQDRGVDGTFTPKYQFNFKEKDATGFYDFGGRIYNPVTGRWLSPDNNLADGLNRYAYARNNPTTRTDPSGHQSQDPKKKMPCAYGDPDGCKDPPDEPLDTAYINSQKGEETPIFALVFERPFDRTSFLTMQRVGTQTRWRGIPSPYSTLYEDRYFNGGVSVYTIWRNGSALAPTDPLGLDNPLLVLLPSNVARTGLTASYVRGAQALGRGLAGAASRFKPNPNILSGHGHFDDINGWITIPEGTSLTIFTRPGQTITDSLGNAIETGGSLTPFADEMMGSRTLLSGTRVPNLTLGPPNNLRIMGNPTVVKQPTQLGDLLKPNMGNVQWAACTVGMPSCP